MNSPESKDTDNDAQENVRGRHASKPREIPKKGWWDILLRVYEEQGKDNLSVIAAGVAFYWFLAIFPALAAGVSIYGLATDPTQLQQHIDTLRRVMPQQAFEILQDQLTALVQQPRGALNIGLIVGILLSIWSANKGVKAFMTALNVVYEEEETRGIIKVNAFSLLITFCVIFLWLIAISFVIAIPVVISKLSLPGLIEGLFVYLRWPLLGLFLIITLAAAYRYCPDRKAPKWRWVSWGSVLATFIWLLVSILFSAYVSNFNNFSQMYGSMGAVVILLIWFFISSYIFLLGGELNAEIEHQTKKDSTIGHPPKPMGEREAYMADTIGEKRA